MGNGIARWFDRLTMSGCALAMTGDGEFHPLPSRERGQGQAQDAWGRGRVFTWMDRILGVMGNGIARWFDRLTMSGCASRNDRGWGISPSPQPSPIEGEGAFDGCGIRGGCG